MSRRVSPEHRQDPLTGDWRLVVVGRALLSRATSRLPSPAGACPFCPGNERDADVCVATIEGPDGWRVRSVRNLYPLVETEASQEASEEAGQEQDGALAATGFHEVIVETPRHDADLVDLDDEEIVDVFRMYRDRVAAIERAGVVQVSLFRNRGVRSGSSQPHAHAQVVGAHVLGSAQARRGARMRAEGRALLQREVERAGHRIIAKEGELSAFTPFAPSQNFETWVVGFEGRCFARLADEELARFAVFSRDVIAAVKRASGRDYNLVFRLPEVSLRDDPRAFWYLEIAPRGGNGAGFELSTGMPVVTVAPEDAAPAIRALFRA